MENQSNSDMQNDENVRGQQQNTSYERKNAAEPDDRNSELKASEDDTSEAVERKHHQQFGNRKYESHTNHSSADDQPGTTTDTTQGL